jgi:hypothetical protein
LKGTTRLTGGALFKVRKVVLCDEVLDVVRRERDAAIQNTKMDGVVKLLLKGTTSALKSTQP